MDLVRVLFLPPAAPEEMLRAVGVDGVEVCPLPEPTTEALHAALPTADVIVGDWTGRLRLGEAEADRATALRLVQQPGTGVDTIDLGAFARRGIPVANTSSVNAQAVAEWCLGAMLSLLRPYHWADDRVRAGGWPQLSILTEVPPKELHSCPVGIVGAGAVARRLGRLLTGFDCPLFFWSPRSRIEGATRLELPELFSRCRVVVVAIARTPDTVGLIDAEMVARLCGDGLLIDVGRGGVVDHDAVVAALLTGRLAGAALDVFNTEPFTPPPSWVGAPGLLLSPHVAGVTAEAMTRTYDILSANISAVRDGGELVHVVNGDPALTRSLTYGRP